MNLQKAIEIQEVELKTAELQTDPDFYNALKLLIEAGKRTIARREELSWKYEPLLPGETEYRPPPGLPLKGIVVKI